MLATRTAFRISLFTGLIVLAINVASLMQPPPAPCGGLPSGYAPIIAFELARSVDDLHATFGSTNDACRAAMVSAMDTVNRLDSLIYIPLYGAFLVFFLLGMRAREKGRAQAAVAITVVACLSDYVENYSLLHLSANLDADSGWLTLLFWSTGVKWVGLGVSALLAGITIGRSAAKWAPPIVLVCSLAAVAAVCMLVWPARIGPLLSLPYATAWTLFLVVAARESLRRDS